MPRIEHITGKAPILARTSQLLALSTTQQNEILDLPYFFSKPARLPQTPHLLILHENEGPTGAVLLTTFGLKLYLSVDRHGHRCVFAPSARRPEVAAQAAQYLLERGARFVNLDFDLGPTLPAPIDQLVYTAAQSATARLVTRPGFEWALHNGRKQFTLSLHPLLKDSLASLGKRTIRNFNYYHRLAERELGAAYVPEVQITLEHFLEHNAVSTYGVPRNIARWRFDSIGNFPETFLSGLRHQNGEWLSLTGARRHGPAVFIDWQLNKKGFDRYSLSTANRAFLIDHEGQQGSTSLSIEGGTRHAMSKYFPFRTVYNLAIRKQNSAFLALAASLTKKHFPKHPIAYTLNKPWRTWHPTQIPKI